MGGRGSNIPVSLMLDGSTASEHSKMLALNLAVSHANTYDEKNAAAYAWLTTEMSADTKTIVNPVTNVEHDAYSAVIGGIEFYFDSLSAGALVTARGLASFTLIPPMLRRSFDYVQIVAESAPDNPDVIARYTDGLITIFNNELIDMSTLNHEAAHGLANQLWSSPAPPSGSDFKAAMDSGEPPPSEYAKTSPGEDFAESVMLFTMQPKLLKRIAPLRYNVIKRLMWHGDYRG